MSNATSSTGTTQIPADLFATILQLAATEPHTIDEAMDTLHAIEDRLTPLDY